MSTDTREIIIGAPVFGCLMIVFAYLYGGWLWATTALVSSSTQITVQFNRIDWLAVSNDVRMGGIKIGNIGKLALEDQVGEIIFLATGGSGKGDQ